MEILATNNTEYLKAWEHELNQCWTENDLYDLFFAHEAQINNDPDIKDLFTLRSQSLSNPIVKAHNGNTLSAKEINKAVAIAAKMPNT